MNKKDIYKNNQELIAQCEQVVFPGFLHEIACIREALNEKTALESYVRSDTLSTIDEDLTRQKKQFIHLYNEVQSVNHMFFKKDKELFKRFETLKQMVVKEQISSQQKYQLFPSLQHYKKVGGGLLSSFRLWGESEKDQLYRQKITAAEETMMEDINRILLSEYYRRLFQLLKNIILDINCNF